MNKKQIIITTMGSCITKDDTYEPEPLIVNSSVNDHAQWGHRTKVAKFRYKQDTTMPSYFDVRNQFVNQSPQTLDQMKAKRRRVKAEELANRYFPK